PGLPTAYLHRTRIDELLDELTQRRVTLLIAPPGSGKTVAVAGWERARSGLDLRWVDPDADHRSVARVPRARSAVGSSHTVVVLDDAHLAPTTSSLLEELLDPDVDGPRLLVVARHQPDWVPMALRLNGQVAELGYADLRLHPDEARQLVRSHCPDVGDA